MAAWEHLSFWDMKWPGVSLPPLLSSPFPAKWITCPSQVISSVVCNIPWEFGTHLYYRVRRGTVNLELYPKTQHSDPPDLERDEGNKSYRQID